MRRIINLSEVKKKRVRNYRDISHAFTKPDPTSCTTNMNFEQFKDSHSGSSLVKHLKSLKTRLLKAHMICIY